MAFIQEKVIIVELDGVDAVFLLEDREDFGGTLRLLSFLAPIENRDHAAELAAERTADARMVHRRAAAEESRQQVALDGPQLVIRKPREIVGRAQMTFLVVNVKAEVVLKGKTIYTRKVSCTAQCREQLQNSVFALPLHCEIDIAGIERGVGIERREISAPNDGNLGMLLAEL